MKASRRSKLTGFQFISSNSKYPQGAGLALYEEDGYIEINRQSVRRDTRLANGNNGFGLYIVSFSDFLLESYIPGNAINLR